MQVPVRDDSAGGGGSLEPRARPTDRAGPPPDVRGMDSPAGHDGPVDRLAFWLAVFLPMLYVPLLFVPPSLAMPFSLVGFSTDLATVAFLTLVGVHLLTLLVGHAYTLRG